MDEQKEKRKHAKHVKHKKSKKVKRKKEKYSSSESESESDEMEWTEASNSARVKQQREEWMEDDSFVPTYSRSDSKKKSSKHQKSEEASLLEKKLLEERELNPYWKDNGSGVPSSKTKVKESSSKLPSYLVGDGGYSWLKKAYQRAKEQAKEEGRTLEDVAAERWGSLSKLEGMLKEAGNRMLDCQSMGSSRSYSSERSKCKSKEYKKDQDQNSSYRNSSRYSVREKSHDCIDRDKYKSNKYDDDDDRKTHSSQRQNVDHDEYESKHDDRHHSHKRNYLEDEKYHSRKEKLQSSSSLHSRFVAPKEYEEKKYSSSHLLSSSYSCKPSWKKKEFMSKSSNGNKSVVKREENASLSSSETKDYSEEVSQHVDTKNIAPKDNFQASDSSSMNSSSDDGGDSELKEEPVLNLNEMNYLAARVLQAKLESDRDLASKIKEGFIAAKNKRAEFLESGGKILDQSAPREEVLLAKVDSYPLPKSLKSDIHRKRRQSKKTEYVGSLRTKHYDDDQRSLKQMFEREKTSTVDEQMKMYFAAASASKESLGDYECDADVSGNVAKKLDAYPSQERDMQKAVQEHKKHNSVLQKCHFCWDQPSLLKHTVIGKGNEVYLCAPSYKSLVEGHCFIVPMNHVSSTLFLDENEYSEIQAFKKGLVKMFSDQNMTVVFMETSFRHKYLPHATIECIPMPRETGDLAPLYFKKAIDESEYEWANNKKLINLSKKSVRNSVPKNFPFFSVEFGLSGGYAHIIENENQFPKYFGKEIIGGMLEIDSYNIVKDRKETTQEICEKVLKLVDMWWKYKDYFTC